MPIKAPEQAGVDFLKRLICRTWEVSVFTFSLAAFVDDIYLNVSKVRVNFGLSDGNGGEQASSEAALVLIWQ